MLSISNDRMHIHYQTSTMKTWRHTQSSFSTNINTPTGTPFQSYHVNSMNPVVFKEKLRVRGKQQSVKHSREKTVRKHKCPMWSNETQHKSKVSWIIYNMLVGIYHNWLRLAPTILYYLSESRRAQIEGLQKMIRNVMREKERYEEMIRTYQSRNSIQFHGPFSQETDDYFDEQLLERMANICNEVKFSTQVLNGQIFAKKRVVKTEKENILANKVIEEMSNTNNMNQNEVKMMLMGSDVSKVAESIVDRIAIVKYMRKNKIKIDQSILKPLKRLFQSQKNFDYDQSITAAKVIEKIKSKFIGTTSHRPKASQTQFKQNYVEKIGDKQNQEELSQNQDKQIRISTPNPDQMNQNDGLNTQLQENHALFDLLKLKSKKKFGFIEEDDEWQRKIRQSFNGDKVKKKNQQIYNQRKVVLNRELKRKKVKTILANLKNEFQSKKEQAYIENRNSNFDEIVPPEKPQQKIKKVEAGNRKTNNQKVLEKIAGQKEREELSRNPKKSQTKSVANQKSASTLRLLNENDESESSSSQSSIVKQKFTNNRSRKFLKPARLIRKKKLKKTTNLFDNNILENFDLELKAEQNVIAKKKKILNLLNSLQASGIIRSKQINKIVSNAKKLNLESNYLSGRKHIKRAHCGGDYPVTSFFMIPLAEEKEVLEKPDQCLPYSFLTMFNKEAILNWKHKKHEPDEWKQFTMQKSKFLGMDYDLNTFKASSQSGKKKTEKEFDKQNAAIEMGLWLIKKFNQTTIHQKGVNRERESACI